MPSLAPLIATALLACAGLANAASGVPKGPLPRDEVPTLVQPELRLDPEQARFSGTVRIEVEVARATRCGCSIAVAVQDAGAPAFDGAERCLHAAQDSELRARSWSLRSAVSTICGWASACARWRWTPVR